MAKQFTGWPIFKGLSHYTVPVVWASVHCELCGDLFPLSWSLLENSWTIKMKQPKVYSIVQETPQSSRSLSGTLFLISVTCLSSENQNRPFRHPQRSSWLWATLGRIVWTTSVSVLFCFVWTAWLIEKSMHLRIRLNCGVIWDLPLTIQAPEISQLTSKTCMKRETTASFNGAHETREITWVNYPLCTCQRF